MKYKQAKRVMADREKAQRRIADIETRRTALVIEFEPLKFEEERVTGAKNSAENAKTTRDALRVRHEEEMTAANARVYETCFAADQLAANFEERNKHALSKRAALDSEDRAARADLARIEKLLPDAEARLAKRQACENCNGSKLVPILCANEMHDATKPGVKGAGVPHICMTGVGPCPECIAVPKVVKIGGNGKIKPGLLVQGGSTPRHPHLAIPRRTRGTPISK